MENAPSNGPRREQPPRFSSRAALPPRGAGDRCRVTRPRGRVDAFGAGTLLASGLCDPTLARLQGSGRSLRSPRFCDACARERQATGTQPPNAAGAGCTMRRSNRRRRSVPVFSGGQHQHHASCLYRAPLVKAPRRWPKSSLSSSASGKAAQFTATQSRVRRGLPCWMTRARGSFPVPVSPLRSPVACKRRARSTILPLEIARSLYEPCSRGQSSRIGEWAPPGAVADSPRLTSATVT